jgi:putative ABC transport system permease protein
MNNFKNTLRHLGKQKLNTALHVVGLTLGMSVCLLIGLFLKHELSYDSWEKNADRIYRINSVWTSNGKESYHFSTPIPLSAALRTDVSGLETVVTIYPDRDAIIEISAGQRFSENRILFAEPEYLDVFEVKVIKGNGRDALSKPDHALLSESIAKKYFGNTEPVGKTFKYNNKKTFTIAGIYKDIPANTHMPATMLLAFIRSEEYLRSDPQTWTNVNGTSTFVVVKEGFKIASLEASLKALADKNINSQPDMPANFKNGFAVQPLKKIHTETKWGGGGAWVQAVNPMWLWFFALIGIAVLVLACINFINLSTAQALTRAKEVGVRKTMGAGRGQLLSYFMAEAWLLASFSGLVSILVVQLALPGINKLTDKQISFELVKEPILLAALILGIVITGILAGIYPAWIISRFQPVDTLKGSYSRSGKRSSILRKGLVIVQFTISISLLIVVMLISQQVNYLRNKSLGFEKENIINVAARDQKANAVFARELSAIPEVSGYAFGTATPINEGHWGTVMSLTNGDDPNRQELTLIMTDDNYGGVYGLRLLSGRFPSTTDTIYRSQSIEKEKRVEKVTVNQKLLSALSLGTPEQAIGKRFWMGMGNGTAEIVGVVADFNTTSLHEALKPTLLMTFPQVYSQAGIKIRAGVDVTKTIRSIEGAWKTAYPDGVFEFNFFDEQIDAYYKAEERLFHLFEIFAAMAMLISCLGLWGLASFASQQRIKEIGIRKVLGASVSNITTLLSKDFLRLVLISILIATPIAWWSMNKWLQDFAYRINIAWWVFALVGAIALLIALLTVSFQAIKAGLSNPVKSLRSE